MLNKLSRNNNMFINFHVNLLLGFHKISKNYKYNFNFSRQRKHYFLYLLMLNKYTILLSYFSLILSSLKTIMTIKTE